LIYLTLYNDVGYSGEFEGNICCIGALANAIIFKINKRLLVL